MPAVAQLIPQQTILMGTALLVGTWAEAGWQRVSATVWCGRILGQGRAGVAVSLLFFGRVFLLQDYPRGGNSLRRPRVAAALCAGGMQVWCLARRCFGNRERALQVQLFTALPVAFLSGFLSAI